MLTRTFYESRLTGPFGPLVLLSLQKKCLRWNRERGITSFLFHDTQRVLQVIEGEAEDVEACMERIKQSPLHDNIKIRAMMRCPDRLFGHWYFGATHVDDVDFKRALTAGRLPNFFDLDILQAERVLSIVASRKRRAVKMDEFSIKVRNFQTDRKPRALFAVEQSRARAAPRVLDGQAAATVH